MNDSVRWTTGCTTGDTVFCNGFERALPDSGTDVRTFTYAALCPNIKHAMRCTSDVRAAREGEAQAVPEAATEAREPETETVSV